MAASLVWLYRYWKINSTWADVPKVAPRRVVKSRELDKLAHWDMVVQKPKEEGQRGSHSGLWRITEHGIRFVLGEFSVPSHVYLYVNNTVEGWSDKLISIKESLGEHFEYEEMMRGGGYADETTID